MVVFAIVLVSAGVYFLFVFEQWSIGSFSEGWGLALPAIALTCGLSILSWNSFGPRVHRPEGIVRRFAPLLLAVILFPCMVEVFGVWLGSADPIYRFMNTIFSNTREIRIDSVDNRSLKISPDGTKVLGLRKDDRWGIASLYGKTSRAISKPSDASTTFGVAWSPDGSRVAGTYEEQDELRYTKGWLFWVYEVKSGTQVTIRAIDRQAVSSGISPGYPAWSPDGSSIALPSVQVRREIYGPSQHGSAARTVGIYDADSLHLRSTIELLPGTRSLWVKYVDGGKLLYYHDPSQGTTGFGELWTVDVQSSEQKRIPLERRVGSSLGMEANRVLVVRNGRWLITALPDPETTYPFHPFLIEIATGRLESLQGLTASRWVLGGLWVEAAVDEHGDVAVVYTLQDKRRWPHATAGVLYYWEEGSNRFIPYQPLFGQVQLPTIDGDGNLILYYWGGDWYVSGLDNK